MSFADLASIISDPDLGGTIFSVTRKTYTRSSGSLVSDEIVTSVMGNIQPGSSEVAKLYPAEYHGEEFIRIYTSFALSVGSNTAPDTFVAPDIVSYRGFNWKVIKVLPWLDVYFAAYAVLILEEEQGG